MNRFARRMLLLMSMLLAVSFGGNALASSHGKRIALLTTATTQPYIGSLVSTFMKGAKAKGWKVTNFTSPYDPALQAQQVDDAVAQKYDLIMLLTVNNRSILPALTRAKAAGVPVILYGNPGQPGYGKLWVTYVGSDQEKLGYAAGESLVRGLAAEGKTKAQVVAITGTSPQLNTILRMRGFKAALAKHPGIKLVAVADGKWNTALSEKIAGDLLVRFAKHGGIDGIYGMSDNQAQGIIQGIVSAGLKVGVRHKGIVVVASNCMKDGIQQIEAGTQYATNTQIPTEEARVALKIVAKFFNGKKLKKNEIVKMHVITRANVARFAKACSY